MTLKVVTASSDRIYRLSVLGLEVEIDGLPCGQEVSFREEPDGSVSVSLTQPEFTEEVEMEVEMPDISLYTALSEVRKSISTEQGVPPYCIFHDSTLHEMCDVMPESLKDMAEVSGVGKAKLEKYGVLFLNAISEYRRGLSA